MKKRRASTIILIIMLFAGIALLAYPAFSEYWNSFRQSRAISDYVKAVEEVDAQDCQEILNVVRDYNQRLADSGIQWFLSEEQMAEYQQLLDVTGTGIMGYIEIPKLDCALAVYHGTEESVLQTSIGHIEGSSFPIGGTGTHCILSGHRGLPSARLFTDLDEMEIGDLFMLQVLDETLTYKVDQILIVEPTDVSALQIEKNRDLCTLVTCTPYGVNSHRLLVRGHRVDNVKESSDVRITADAVQIEPLLVAPAVAIPILLVLLVILLIDTRKSRRGR